MSVPTIGDVRMVVSIANAAGNTFQNVIHGHYTNLVSGLESDLLSVAKQYVEDVFDSYWAFVSQNWTALDTLVYLYNEVTGLFDPIGSVSNDHLFTAIGDPLPAQDAPLVGLVTANPRVRGRVYLPAPVETENGSDGNPSAAVLAALALVVAAIATSQTYAEGTMAGHVFSRKLATFANVVSGTVSPYWATQRRRRPGVGI